MAITELQLEEDNRKILENIETVKAEFSELKTKISKAFEISNCQELKEAERIIEEKGKEQLLQLQAQVRSDDDKTKKEIHIFKDLRLLGTVMFQYRYLQEDNNIARYGDIYACGLTGLYGCGFDNNLTSSSFVPTSNWTRVMLPYGTEIIEVVSDGVGTWYIEKTKQKAFYSGRITNKDSNNYTGIPFEVTFSSKIQKILVGKVTRLVYNSATQNNHIAVIILENGEAYGFGDNDSKAISQDYTSFYSTPKKLEVDGHTIKDGVVGNCGSYSNFIILIGEKDGKTVLLGSGKNISSCLGGSENNKTAFVQLYMNDVDGVNKKPIKVWAFVGTKGTYESDVVAQVYVSVELASDKQKHKLYGIGYNGQKQIDKYRSDEKIDSLQAIQMPTQSGDPLENVISMQGIAYKSIIVAETKDKKLYITGLIPYQMLNVKKTNGTDYQGFQKITSGSGSAELKHTTYWVYGCTNPTVDAPSHSSENDGGTKPILIWHNSEHAGGYYFSGWNYATSTPLKDAVFFSRLRYEEFLDLSSGINVVSGDCSTDYGSFMAYGISKDKKNILILAYYSWTGNASNSNYGFVPLQGFPLL